MSGSSRREVLTKSIWLCGLMGSGKSTVGAAAAAHFAVPFVDNDATVAELAGWSTVDLADRSREVLHAWESRYVRHLAGRAEDVAAHTYELSELLIDVLGIEDVGAHFPHRVTYHPTCHSLRMLRVADKPLRLLRAVRGIDLVELPAAEQCCGFGGTFAVKNGETSTAMLADKMRHVTSTGADVLTAGDSSCLMHIGGGLSRLRVGTRTVHLAEILAGEGWEAAL